MILSLYKKHKSIRAVSEITGNSRDVVSRELAKHGICDFVKVPQEKQTLILELYNDKLSMKEISKMAGCGLKQVNYIVIANRAQRKRTPKIKKDEKAFEVIDTEEKAYWLGLLYADGCVNLKSTVLELTLKDEEHVNKFKEFMKTDAKVRTKKVTIEGKENTYYKISICSKKIISDLISLGCTERKSLTLTFPTENQIPTSLISHFIRGYFDGDGTVGKYVRSKSRHPIYSFKILGTLEFLTRLSEILDEAIGAEQAKLKRHSGVYEYARGGRLLLLKIRKFLYQDATIYMSRKYDVFNTI